MPSLKKLTTKKGRDECGLFIIEGEKFVDEIPGDTKIVQYAVSESYSNTHDLSGLRKRARCEIVKDNVFSGISSTVTTQGILAVCEKKEWILDDILSSDGFVLLCEEINDPGNLGTLIRTATAAGASGIVLTSGSCEVYNPKVLRASAGAVLRLPIVFDVDVSEVMNKLDMPIYAAHPRGDILPYNVNMKEKFCLLIGSESHGISKTAESFATKLIKLPMTNETESLNASVAGCILMYEAVRQKII